MLLQLVVVCALATIASAQVPGFGNCPDVPATKQFDVQKYTGYWYEQRRLPFIHQTNGDCTRTMYSSNDAGDLFIAPKNMDVVGHGIAADKQNEPAKFDVLFYSWQPRMPYWVVETDYDTYSLVFSCNNVLGISHIQRAWILTRQPPLDAAVIERLTTLAASYGVAVEEFLTIGQTNCNYDE